MKIEVGKKYQDRSIPNHPIEIIGKHGEDFLVRYKSGHTADVTSSVIELFYEPFEETPCDN